MSENWGWNRKPSAVAAALCSLPCPQSFRPSNKQWNKERRCKKTSFLVAVSPNNHHFFTRQSPQSSGGGQNVYYRHLLSKWLSVDSLGRCYFRHAKPIRADLNAAGLLSPQKNELLVALVGKQRLRDKGCSERDRNKPACCLLIIRPTWMRSFSYVEIKPQLHISFLLICALRMAAELRFEVFRYAGPLSV